MLKFHNKSDFIEDKFFKIQNFIFFLLYDSDTFLVFGAVIQFFYIYARFTAIKHFDIYCV